MSLRGRSPLAQTWLERALPRATDISIVEKHDHIPVLSRQGRPPLSAPFAGTTALDSTVAKKDIQIPSNAIVTGLTQ
jgi:hypothetical protein